MTAEELFPWQPGEANGVGSPSDLRDKIDAAITAARLEGAKAMQERCRQLAEDEEKKRLDNSYRAAAGDKAFGLDTKHQAMIQGHKAITAGKIKEAIDAIDPATVGGGG